jgi:dTDP-4-amino-4,6-dideoxygalactose transaminase
MLPLNDLKRIHEPILGELKEVAWRVIASNRFILGAEVENFEDELATLHGPDMHAVAVSSGTDALLSALMSQCRGGGEVITTPYTFAATAMAIVRAGLRPVFVDIDPETYLLDTNRVAAAINERTVALMPVHLFGQCVHVPALVKLGKGRLVVIEDAAQAIGAQLGDQLAGTMGDCGCFSFFPAKTLGAFGDAGAVLTGFRSVAERLRCLRQQGGMSRGDERGRYRHEVVGGNFRMDALQAALLRVKLPHLREYIRDRRAAAARYAELFATSPSVIPPIVGRGRLHTFAQYVVRVGASRDRVRAALTTAHIGSAVYYPLPLHLQPAFASLGYKEGDFPHAEAAAKETLALPLFPGITADEQKRVADVVRRAL